MNKQLHAFQSGRSVVCKQCHAWIVGQCMRHLNHLQCTNMYLSNLSPWHSYLQQWWCETGCKKWQHSGCEWGSCGGLLQWDLGNSVRWWMVNHWCWCGVQAARFLQIQWVIYIYILGILILPTWVHIHVYRNKFSRYTQWNLPKAGHHMHHCCMFAIGRYPHFQ